jgi:hypothetical protein
MLLMRALSESGRHARLWDPTTGDQLGRALPFDGGNETQFSADGTMLVVPGADSISIWNLDRATRPALRAGSPAAT